VAEFARDRDFFSLIDDWKINCVQGFPAKIGQALISHDPQHVAVAREVIFLNPRLTSREYGQGRIRVLRKGE